MRELNLPLHIQILKECQESLLLFSIKELILAVPGWVVQNQLARSTRPWEWNLKCNVYRLHTHPSSVCPLQDNCPTPPSMPGSPGINGAPATMTYAFFPANLTCPHMAYTSPSRQQLKTEIIFSISYDLALIHLQLKLTTLVIFS